jgi:hypothetical protein
MLRRPMEGCPFPNAVHGTPVAAWFHEHGDKIGRLLRYKGRRTPVREGGRDGAHGKSRMTGGARADDRAASPVILQLMCNNVPIATAVKAVG